MKLHTKSQVTVLVGLIAFSCLTQCAHQQQVQQLQQLALQNDIPLIQAAYARGHRTVVFETSAYPETPARKDAGTVFQAASLSKPVFAYIVLKMAYEGLLDLDVPLATYTDIERFEDKERARLLTARMVLCHVTGLSNWAAGPGSESGPGPQSRLSGNLAVPLLIREKVLLFAACCGSCLWCGPGTNSREQVFDPLGMDRTSYVWLPVYDSLAVDGYNREKESSGKGFSHEPMPLIP